MELKPLKYGIKVDRRGARNPTKASGGGTAAR